MTLPIPQFRPPPLPEPTPVVLVVPREDVRWDRPLFKAPPIEVKQSGFDFGRFADELRGFTLGTAH